MRLGQSWHPIGVRHTLVVILHDLVISSRHGKTHTHVVIEPATIVTAHKVVSSLRKECMEVPGPLLADLLRAMMLLFFISASSFSNISGKRYALSKNSGLQ